MVLGTALHSFGHLFKWRGWPWIFPVIILIWLLFVLSPHLQRKGTSIKMPFARSFSDLATVLSQKAKSLPHGPMEFILGASTTLLPCAWLYGFLILASSRADLLEVWSVILLFWLGTLPALILAQTAYFKLNSFFQTKFRGWARAISTTLVVTLSLVTLWTHYQLIEGILHRSEARDQNFSCPLHPKH
jgi:sulfite exporter TauE/SafE